MPDTTGREGSTLAARLVFALAVINLLFLIAELGLNVGKALL